MSFNEIYKLRKINRDLFDQLETNSVLLENKLRKLKENARSSKDFIQSGQSSSLKKRRRCWKMRNDSGRMFEVLNSKLPLQSSSNDNTPQAEDKTKQLIMARPSEKSKRKKPVKGTKNSFTPYRNTNRVSQPLNYSESNNNPDKDKRNELVYDIPKNALQTDHQNQHLTDEENVTLNNHKTLNAQSRKEYVPDRIGNDKLLQEVGNIIDYTPKSIFLQRLKERSQRNVCNSNGSPRKAVYSKFQTPAITSLSNTLKKDMRKTVLSTKENQVKYSLKDAAKSANSCGCCCSPCVCACSIPVSNTPTLKKKEILPLKQKKNRKRMKKKRVCYRRNCYCRKAPQGAPSANKKTSAKKENMPYVANEVGRSPNAPSFSYRQCCSPHSAHPKDNAAFGHIFSARAPQESSCYCTCQETGSWFNALRKFRDSHWFDCHAKPISICLDSNEHRILQNHCKCYQEDDHTCVHQYVVNDRLFMEPLCADYKGKSRCIYCKLPRKKDRTSNFLQSKTKPFKEELLVSLPLNMLSPERNKNYILSNKRDESKKTPHKRSIRIKRSPPPANSLALRFQKGVL